jgi:DsbC/DsbD-like thiol-disulfide interchange protein
MMPDATRRGRWENLNLGFLLQSALLFIFLSLFTAPIVTRGATGPHGCVDLIAEETSIKPARPFWVGLHFQLERGWHIYWTNPGDSGEPPRLKWDLPAGFHASSIHWPLPSRFEDHSLVDFGYQNEVVLPVEITPPSTLGTGPEAQLSATVNWLVCRDVCVPGRAALTLTLSFRKETPGPPTPGHILFAKARAKLPRPVPNSWRVSANLDKREFLLSIETGKREAGATFFRSSQIK